jgi:energy-converting hydrogenase Eha subunit A
MARDLKPAKFSWSSSKIFPGAEIAGAEHNVCGIQLRLPAIFQDFYQREKIDAVNINAVNIDAANINVVNIDVVNIDAVAPAHLAVQAHGRMALSVYADNPIYPTWLFCKCLGIAQVDM